MPWRMNVILGSNTMGRYLSAGYGISRQDTVFLGRLRFREGGNGDENSVEK